MRLPDSHAYRGRSFELELEQTHAEYVQKGFARIVRLHVPRVFSRRKNCMVYTQRTLTDYVGFTQGGRVVLLEAKSIKSKKEKTWRPDRQHQFEALVEAASYGGLALYIIRRGIDEARLYFPQGHQFGDAVDLEECPLVERQWGPLPWPWLEVAWVHWNPS